MKKMLIVLFLLAQTRSIAQDLDTKGFFIKYFCGLDISKNYSEWIKSFTQNASVLKHGIRNPELSDTIFVNYRILKHPLIADDSTKAFLNHKLKINVDTISHRIIDSVFIIHSYFIYGKGKVARKKMSDKFVLVRKETNIFGKEFTISGPDSDSKDHYYTGFSYDFKKNTSWPYLFSIAWTKNKYEEYILRLSYFIHFRADE